MNVNEDEDTEEDDGEEEVHSHVLVGTQQTYAHHRGSALPLELFRDRDANLGQGSQSIASSA